LARSALIVKLAAIGDVVMALPMVSALQARDPSVRIDWMCGRVVAPLLRQVEGLTEVVVVDEKSMLVGSSARKGMAVARAWLAVAGRQYDTVYVAHSDIRYQFLTWALRTGHTRSLSGTRRNRGIVPGRTHTDEYVRLVTGLDDARAPAYPPPRLAVRLPDSLEERLQRANPDGRPLIALTPGGARNVARENPLRRWPLEQYADLAESLDQEGYRVVLTGDRIDGWVRSVFWHLPVADFIGATDLPALAALLQRCAAIVAHDSGPLHIARAVGTPVVALLGPTPPSMFFRPSPHTAVLWPGGMLPCAPCYDGYDFADCSSNVCMQMIDYRSVMLRLRALVEASHRGTPPGTQLTDIVRGPIERPAEQACDRN